MLYKLKQINQRLCLVNESDKDSLGKPICVDFSQGAIRHRVDFGGGKNQLLAKAIGCHKHQHLKVIDATAGLGRDSFILASLGCQVTAIERNNDIHALLADGISRGIQDGIAALKNLTLHNNNAQSFLQEINEGNKPDVIYFDPMYPHRNKSALVKKDMRIIRQVVGDDHDNEQLLQLAIQKAKYRVVIKRPIHAEHYAGLAPDFSYKGKRSRFDIYNGQLE